MKQILQFNGLYGDNHSSFISDFFHFETLEHRSKMYSWEINEHLHTELFQIFIFKSGNGILLSDKNKIIITSPSVIIVPASTMHGFSFENNIIGDVLTFSDSYLENILKNTPNLYIKLNIIKQFSFADDTNDFNEIHHLINNIKNEIQYDNFEKPLALQCNFQLLFLKLFRKRTITEKFELKTTNKTLQYFQQYQKLIKQSLNNPLTIEEYANKIGITQMHLNRVCHTIVNESALKVVQSYLIAEAKKYLLNTSYSISEIAYFLNFNYPAYFCRLFKKTVGVSPSEFRKT